MRCVIFDDNISEEDLRCILNNYIDFSDVGYQTSNSILKGKKENTFFKKLNIKKIKSLYNGDYLKLFNEYYFYIRNIIKTNEIIGLIEEEGEIYEFSRIIDDKLFLDNGNIFSWQEINKLFDCILAEINKCVEFNKGNNKKIGFETAIWNFTIDGTLFDLDPPKILKDEEDTSFTRKEDQNHIKRTIYRSFTEIGMKCNLLVTLILGEKHNSFIIKNKPNDYLNILLNKVINSFIDKQDMKKLINNFNNGVPNNENFIDHPIEILRRELTMREKAKNKKIIFVAGTSESGKSGGINYLKGKYQEIQHIKIRDIFPLVYNDTLSNLSFEEWQDYEENRDLNNFWRLFVNKVYEVMDDDKEAVILDTMYGVNGMIELYKILKDRVKLLYIDAPFKDRVMREYLRLRTDSIKGTRKADLSVTIDDVVERTRKKDLKKNKKGANKLPFLSYSETMDDIEINGKGAPFTYIINNSGSIDEFHEQLDKYMDKILAKDKPLIKEKKI